LKRFGTLLTCLNYIAGCHTGSPMEPPISSLGASQDLCLQLRSLTTGRAIEAVIKQLQQGEADGSYQLGSWVLMPNHLHLILQPLRPLAKAIAHLKACSGRDANRLLHRVGKPFWTRDYFDRWIRGREELQRIIRYIERNPINAALCSSMEEWPWSSANPKFVWR